MCAFSLEELVLSPLTEGHSGSFPPGDCMEALCGSCCSLQCVVTLSTIHSGLFCSKNALIYTFWGLLLNDETFNVCKFWKWGSQWNKVVFFGESWVFCLLSRSPEHMKQAPTGPLCRSNVDRVKPANPKCHYYNAWSDQMKHFGCIIHSFRFYLNSVWTVFHVDKRHD